MMAAKASTKKPRSGDKNASTVMSANRTVTEFRSISSEISRTDNDIVALTSFTPSVKVQKRFTAFWD